MISMKRQRRCHVQLAKVFQRQEVDLGGLGHGHEVHSRDKVGMQHIKTISMEKQSRCQVQQAKVLQHQEVDLGGLGHGHEVHSSVKVGHAAHQNNRQEEAK